MGKLYCLARRGQRLLQENTKILPHRYTTGCSGLLVYCLISYPACKMDKCSGIMFGTELEAIHIAILTVVKHVGSKADVTVHRMQCAVWSQGKAMRK